eukprot:1161397-Pelagomonas_calceolata.AAC.3
MMTGKVSNRRSWLNLGEKEVDWPAESILDVHQEQKGMLRLEALSRFNLCSRATSSSRQMSWSRYKYWNEPLNFVRGKRLQSFSYHLALFLVAGPVFFLRLPYFSQSELRDGERWSGAADD